MEPGNVIHCIGDSHASFFSGYDEIQPVYPSSSKNKYPFLKGYRLGSVLAYSLNKLNTKEKGREKLFQLITELPLNSTLLMCFGEIDCRCHLINQAEQRNISIEDSVKDCVSNYFEIIDKLLQLNFKVLIWNVVPTAESNNIEYPVYGTHIERNKCTIKFNSALKSECDKRGLFFVSIFEKLITRNFKTKTVYFFDSIHLGQLAMPYFFKK